MTVDTPASLFLLHSGLEPRGLQQERRRAPRRGRQATAAATASELHGLGSASPEIIPSVTRRPSAYVERSFLVESPRGELMQVELLRPVAAAGGEGFVVRVLDECGETWEETEDIGDAAVLVDAAGAVAASTAECPALRPNTVYFAVDLEGETRVWAYSLAGKHKRIEVVEALPTADGYRPPCFWFAPVYSQP